MAVIVMLEGELPPVVLPPYSMSADTTVDEVLQSACRFFKRDPSSSTLVSFDTGAELLDGSRVLGDYGLGHWSLFRLESTDSRKVRRVTFGA